MQNEMRNVVLQKNTNKRYGCEFARRDGVERMNEWIGYSTYSYTNG